MIVFTVFRCLFFRLGAACFLLLAILLAIVVVATCCMCARRTPSSAVVVRFSISVLRDSSDNSILCYNVLSSSHSTYVYIN